MSHSIEMNAERGLASHEVLKADRHSAATETTIPPGAHFPPASTGARESVDPDGFLVTAQRRVLIAEDRESAAEALRTLLEHLGYETVVTRDGLAALAALRETPVDLAILDIGLPGMDGWKVARTITQEMRDPPRMVALSAFSEQTDIDESLRCGFSEHLVKPIRLEELRRVLG